MFSSDIYFLYFDIYEDVAINVVHESAINRSSFVSICVYMYQRNERLLLFCVYSAVF